MQDSSQPWRAACQQGYPEAWHRSASAHGKTQRETEVAKLLVCRVVWIPFGGICMRLTCLPVCPRT